MSRRIRLLCVAVIVTLAWSDSRVALAQYGYGAFRGFRSYGAYGGYGNFFDSGIGAFGGGTYPGRAFGYDPRYLASRAFTAGGVTGGLTYGTPQPPPAEAPATVLARAIKPTKDSPDDKVLQGETAFWDGNYASAIDDWMQVLAAGPRNPVLVLMLGQAYFAAGNYQEAAAMTREGMQALPQDRWGVVISNRKELYANPHAYASQLQQLESAVKENPKDSAQRFLLAYHYASLGYPQPAVTQLHQVVELDPRDETAIQLLDALLPRLPAPGAPVITPGVTTRGRG